MSLHGWEDIIPIFFAFVGMMATLYWVAAGLGAAAEWNRKRRAVKAQTGAPAVVARIDGLEARMDKLESGVVKIIELLESQKTLSTIHAPQIEERA